MQSSLKWRKSNLKPGRVWTNSVHLQRCQLRRVCRQWAAMYQPRHCLEILVQRSAADRLAVRSPPFLRSLAEFPRLRRLELRACTWYADSWLTAKWLSSLPRTLRVLALPSVPRDLHPLISRTAPFENLRQLEELAIATNSPTYAILLCVCTNLRHLHVDDPFLDRADVRMCFQHNQRNLETMQVFTSRCLPEKPLAVPLDCMLALRKLVLLTSKIPWQETAVRIHGAQFPPNLAWLESDFTLPTETLWRLPPTLTHLHLNMVHNELTDQVVRTWKTTLSCLEQLSLTGAPHFSSHVLSDWFHAASRLSHVSLHFIQREILLHRLPPNAELVVLRGRASLKVEMDKEQGQVRTLFPTLLRMQRANCFPDMPKMGWENRFRGVLNTSSDLLPRTWIRLEFNAVDGSGAVTCLFRSTKAFLCLMKLEQLHDLTGMDGDLHEMDLPVTLSFCTINAR